MISSLIDKQDMFEVVRDQIAAILVEESANQQVLAVGAGKDPELWKLRIFTETSNAFEGWLKETTDRSPVINVWFDAGSFPEKNGNVVKKQEHNARFNVDCYGVGVSADIPGGGHSPGDSVAALEAHRAVRLVRNILMASIYTYLGLPRGDVGQRWPISITSFQPSIDGVATPHVVGVRLSLGIRFNEYAPQFEGEELSEIQVDIKRTEDGQIVLEADYEFPL